MCTLKNCQCYRTIFDPVISTLNCGLLLTVADLAILSNRLFILALRPYKEKKEHIERFSSNEFTMIDFSRIEFFLVTFITNIFMHSRHSYAKCKMFLL